MWRGGGALLLILLAVSTIRDNQTKQTKQIDSINFLGHLKTLLEQYTIIIANLVHTCIEQSKD